MSYDPTSPSQIGALLANSPGSSLRRAMCSVLPAVDFNQCCVMALFVGKEDSLDFSVTGNRMVYFAIFTYEFLAHQVRKFLWCF